MSFSRDIYYKCRQAIAANFDYLVVWAEPNSDEIRYNAYNGENLPGAVQALGKKALEVYDLRVPLAPQISERRAWNMPTSKSSLPSPCEPVELPVEPSL